MRFFRALALIFCLITPAFAKQDWLPIGPQDLQLKEVPQMRGAHAVLLYFEDNQDDREGRDTLYYRIKILTEEGKKYANVELPAYGDDQRVQDLEARMIRPDGSVVPFTGKIYDKIVAKYRDYKLVSKTFSIPEVQVGSIIEYRYARTWDPYWAYSSWWQVTQNLFLLKGHFIFHPKMTLLCSYTWFGLPAGKKPIEGKDRTYTLDVENIFPFEEEDFIPPSRELRSRVEFFYYGSEPVKSVDEFWDKSSKDWHEGIEEFMKKPKEMQREIAAIVQPGDSKEVKLRKIYERVQKVRKLSWEREKSEKESKREKLKDITTVADVLKYGYGWHNQTNAAFVALARAAGLDAQPVRVVERDRRFFHQELMYFDQLTDVIAYVRVDGKEYYLSPATPFCPFGVIPWQYTNTTALLYEEGKRKFLTTPLPKSEGAITRRSADFELTRDGTLKGKLTITYDGVESLHRRLAARNDDDVERKKDLEKEIQDWLPNGGSVELIKAGDWNSTEPLVAEFNLEVPGIAVATSKRLLLPAYLFLPSKGHAFQQTRRVNPVYFQYPWRNVDDIHIRIPEGLRIETVPKKRQINIAFGVYSNDVTGNGTELRVQRTFGMDSIYFGPQYYAELQKFFNQVKEGDDDRIAVQK